MNNFMKGIRLENLEIVRKAEKDSHDSCNENYKLVEDGSW